VLRSQLDGTSGGVQSREVQMTGRITTQQAGRSAVETAMEEFRAGRFVIVVDDEDRENEGDLVLAAEFVTPDAINFMARYGRGSGAVRGGSDHGSPIPHT